MSQIKDKINGINISLTLLHHQQEPNSGLTPDLDCVVNSPKIINSFRHCMVRREDELKSDYNQEMPLLDLSIRTLLATKQEEITFCSFKT